MCQLQLLPSPPTMRIPNTTLLQSIQTAFTLVHFSGLTSLQYFRTSCLWPLLQANQNKISMIPLKLHKVHSLFALDGKTSEVHEML